MFLFWECAFFCSSPKLAVAEWTGLVDGLQLWEAELKKHCNPDVGETIQNAEMVCFFCKVRHLVCLLESFDNIDRACSSELVQSRPSG